MHTQRTERDEEREGKGEGETETEAGSNARRRSKSVCSFPLPPLRSTKHAFLSDYRISHLHFRCRRRRSTRSREDNKRAQGWEERDSGGGNNTSAIEGGISPKQQRTIGSSCCSQVAKPMRSAFILCILRASACCLRLCRVHFECSSC